MKTEIKENLMHALSRVEHHISKAKYDVKEKFNLLEPLKIFPYYGFGNEKYVFIKEEYWRMRR